MMIEKSPSPKGEPIEHIQEPWESFPFGGYILGPPDEDGYREMVVASSVTTPKKRASLRHIVACVNACVGIPTSTLEDVALQYWLDEEFEDAFNITLGRRNDP